MPDTTPPERTVIVEDESLRQFVGGFTSIPNRILRNSQISLGARMCYSMLLSYAWQENFCFPAQTRLAEDLGIGERTVRQYLNELRDAELITWKQRGLNRPNIYQILKMPALTPTNGNGHPGPAESAGPDRQRTSGQDRNSASAYKDSEKNTHTVVNDVTPNDHDQPQREEAPTISDRVLRAKYRLANDQIGRVHWLVEKQVEILGAADRNHAAYVKRAAEAVRDGNADRLDFTLSDFKQAATEIAVGSRPAYFHAMWIEALKEAGAAPPSVLTRGRSPGATTGRPEPVQGPVRHTHGDQIDSRTRLIADAERRGFTIPDYIRTADIRTVNRWWAALLEAPTKRS